MTPDPETGIMAGKNVIRQGSHGIFSVVTAVSNDGKKAAIRPVEGGPAFVVPVWELALAPTLA